MDKVVTEKLVQKKMDESDEVYEECRHCQQPFLSKYWDHELEWYIDINLTPLCKKCTDLLKEK